MWVVIWRHFEHAHCELHPQTVASSSPRVEVSKTKYENWTLPFHHTLADFKAFQPLRSNWLGGYNNFYILIDYIVIMLTLATVRGYTK